METRKKNSQQEIVGFMIIVLIVVIVGVIFLGIWLRQDDPIVKEDAEISNFIISSLRYTTDCYKNSEPNYRSLGDLIGDCYQKNSGIVCPASQDSCFVLNNTYNWMLQKLWPSGKDRPIRYVKMGFFYSQNSSSDEKNRFMSINQGLTNSSCGVLKAGSNALSMDGGNIIIELEICKSG